MCAHRVRLQQARQVRDPHKGRQVPRYRLRGTALVHTIRAEQPPVADYSAQAVVNTILTRAFPTDPIVGEEDATDLRQEGADILRNRIVDLANEALTANLTIGDRAEWGLGPGQQRTLDELLDAIDRGNDQGGPLGRASTVLLLPPTPH